ncbi:MAG TPA: hypothetical protein DEP00_01605 [Lachnospiraceae bacterium]|nr:hypothetical protein [Lachnospiraceae bacterium]
MAVMKIDSFSAAMGRNISFLAAGPLESLKAGQKMRALYLLHGVTGAASNWFSLTAASRKAIEANSHRAAGKDPVCLISLSGGNGFYHPVPDKRDGAWRPGADHKHDYQAFIGQEIVSLTRKMLPISDKREDTGILGLSMGGYGALRTGLLYRQTFGFAAGLSCALLTRIPTEDEGAFWLRPDFEKVIFGPDGPSLEDDVEDLAISLAKEGQTLPRLMVACGTEDSLLAYNRQLDQDWKKAGIEHDYLEHPGAHEWAFWEWGLEKALERF